MYEEVASFSASRWVSAAPERPTAGNRYRVSAPKRACEAQASRSKAGSRARRAPAVALDQGVVFKAAVPLADRARGQVGRVGEGLLAPPPGGVHEEQAGDAGVAGREDMRRAPRAGRGPGGLHTTPRPVS